MSKFTSVFFWGYVICFIVSLFFGIKSVHYKDINLPSDTYESVAIASFLLALLFIIVDIYRSYSPNRYKNYHMLDNIH
jgi:hypothetical protein